MFKLRKSISLLLCVVLCLSLLPAMVYASDIAEYPENGYEYEEKQDGTLKLINLKEECIPETDYIMNIPETIDGKTVTELGRFGNYRCGGSNLISVTIPKTVTRISGTHANSPFQDCPKLKTVTLFDTVEILGYQAFTSCPMLEDIIVKNSKTNEVLAHWPETFQYMPNLHTVEKGVFFGCTGLSCDVLVIPENIEIMGSQPFNGVDIRTMYIMRKDPSKYNFNFLFPNTRENFVAICPDKETYDIYHEYIHSKEYGNQYSRYLTYEMDVNYDGHESEIGGVKHSLFMQPLHYKEMEPANPFSLWLPDKSYKMLPTQNQEYHWFWNPDASGYEVTPNTFVTSDRLYEVHLNKPLAEADDITEVYTGEKYYFNIKAKHSIVNPDTDPYAPKDGECVFYYKIYNHENVQIYSGFTPNECAVKNVKDSSLGSPYKVFVYIKQYDKENKSFKTIYDPQNTPGCTFNVNIAKADPIVHPFCIEKVPTGTKLGDIEIDYLPTDTKGTITWDEPDTSVKEGANSYQWTFVPDDTDNYNTPLKGSLPVEGVSPDSMWVVTLHNESDYRKIFVEKGSSVKLMPNPFTKEEHAFKSWNTVLDGSGTSYEDETTITPESNLDLYAQWIKALVVTYDIGPGATWEELPPNIKRNADGTFTQFVQKGEILSRPTPPPTKPGYEVKSWKYRQCFGSACFEQDYYFGLDPVNRSMTLKAQWDIPRYKVVFVDADDNPIGYAQKVKKGEDATAPVPPNKEGYTFIKWDKEFSNIQEDTVVKTIYDPNCYEVLFDGNGCTDGSMKNQDFVYDEEKALSKNKFTKEGYNFVCWNTEPDGSGTSFNDLETVKNLSSNNFEIIGLYAQWEIAEYQLNWDFDGGAYEGEYTKGSTKYGANIIPPKPEKEGYLFDGWSPELLEYMPAHDITFTANWRKIPRPTPVTPNDPEIEPELNIKEHIAYIIGTSDELVSPEKNITRAETATIFFRLLEDESRKEFWSTKSPFEDVNEQNWYNNAVSTMANAGILKGYEDGSFRPNTPVSRAEFASIAARFSHVNDFEGCTFSDVPTEHWAYKDISIAQHLGWIKGFGDGTFRPDSTIKRCEAVALINRVLERAPDPSHMLPSMKKWKDNTPDKWYYADIQEATNSHDYKRINISVSGEEVYLENWTSILPPPDWKKLEQTWIDENKK